MIDRVCRLVVFAMCCACSAVARADITVVAPWVRGVVPGQTATGAFMTIRSTEATTLVGASSPAADSVQLHQMSVDNGTMRMRPVESVAIAPHGHLDLQPGSYHLMIVGLNRSLVTGDTVPLTLRFRDPDGRERSTQVQAEVRDLTASAPKMKGM